MVIVAATKHDDHAQLQLLQQLKEQMRMDGDQEDSAVLDATETDDLCCLHWMLETLVDERKNQMKSLYAFAKVLEVPEVLKNSERLGLHG